MLVIKERQPSARSYSRTKILIVVSVMYSYLTSLQLLFALKIMLETSKRRIIIIVIFLLKFFSEPLSCSNTTECQRPAQTAFPNGFNLDKHALFSFATENLIGRILM